MASKNDIKVRRGNEERYFSTQAWKELPANKYGWKPVVEMPDEVKQLAKKATAGDTSQQQSSAPAATEEIKLVPVGNVVKLIQGAATADEVNEIVGTDTRVTVLKAAEFRINELNKPAEGDQQQQS